MIKVNPDPSSFDSKHIFVADGYFCDSFLLVSLKGTSALVVQATFKDYSDGGLKMFHSFEFNGGTMGKIGH